MTSASHVKMLATGQPESRRFDSGKDLGPDDLVAQVREVTSDWSYDVISLGFPAPVNAHGAAVEPGNLGDGWVGYDIEAAFRRSG